MTPRHREQGRSRARSATDWWRRAAALPLPLVVAVVAVCWRLAVLASLADAPSFQMPLVDAEVAYDAATALATGRGFTEAFFFQSFLYPFLLGLLFVLTGPSVLAAQLVQTLAGGATAALVAHFGHTTWSSRVGWIAGLGTALCSPLALHELETLGTGLAALWAVVLVVAAQWFVCRPRATTALVLGTVTGLAIVTRPVFLPVAMALAVVAVLPRVRTHLRPAALMLLPVVVILGLVATVTEVESGQFTPLPASGGLNLYLGNHPDRCATMTIRPGAEWHDLLHLPTAAGAEGLWRENAWFRARVWDWVRNDPSRVLVGVGHKLVEFFSSRELPRNIDLYLLRRWSSPLAATMWRWGPFGFPVGVIVPLALVGLVARWREIPAVVTAALLVYPAALALVFSSSRHRAPWLPLAILVAALGVDALWGWWSRRDLVRGGAALVLVVVAAGLISLPGPFCVESDLEGEYWFLVGAAHLRSGHQQAARRALERSLALEPGRFETHATLAIVFDAQGRPADARRHLEAAAVADPRRVEVWRELGELELRMGDTPAGIEALTQAVRLDPSDARTQLNLGSALARQGRYAEALEHLEVAARLAPRDRRAQRSLAEVRQRLGRDATAS